MVRPLATSDTTRSSTPTRRRWRLRTICGWKLASRSRGTSSSTGPTSVSTVLARVPPGGVAAVAADRVAVLVAKVVGELALKRALHHQLRHALQQPVWADQTDALCPGLGDQLRGELLVHGIRPCAGRALGLRGLGRRLRHVVSPPVCHRHTLSWSYTVVFTVLVPAGRGCRTAGWLCGQPHGHATRRECDTKGARCEWIALVGGPGDAGDVISGQCPMACPRPGVRRW